MKNLFNFLRVLKLEAEAVIGYETMIRSYSPQNHAYTSLSEEIEMHEEGTVHYRFFSNLLANQKERALELESSLN